MRGGRGGDDAPTGQMPEQAVIPTRWLKPTVPESDGGKIEPGSWSEHDPGKTDECEITTQNIVRTWAGKLLE